MTKARQQRPPEFVTDEEQPGLDDAGRRDLDAIEAVFKTLNAADEVETARRALVG